MDDVNRLMNLKVVSLRINNFNNLDRNAIPGKCSQVLEIQPP